MWHGLFEYVYRPMEVQGAGYGSASGGVVSCRCQLEQRRSTDRQLVMGFPERTVDCDTAAYGVTPRRALQK